MRQKDSKRQVRLMSELLQLSSFHVCSQRVTKIMNEGPKEKQEKKE